MSFFFSTLFNFNAVSGNTTGANSAAQDGKANEDYLEQLLTPNREVIAMIEPDSHNTRGTQGDSNADDEFVQVDLKKLSYAEIASLKGVNTSSSSVAPVFNEADLGADVSDYQMTAQFKKQRSASSSSSSSTAAAAATSQKTPYLTPNQVAGDETLFVGGNYTTNLINDSTIDDMVDNGLVDSNNADPAINDGFKKYTRVKRSKGKAKAKRVVVVHAALELAESAQEA
ncbi:hypothetical protein WICPIJ_007456 [Wickerhamomyces pijperi]|uniref:Uncharacterized protein n=1 Tax=Wickerhamomyces pijperi TaxID=599730 RepID=A0A9P8Q1T4_WICPI|nr:hypothetical protein WICPIJ_007456 [Wickerhamomyces pijperi]